MRTIFHPFNFLCMCMAVYKAQLQASPGKTCYTLQDILQIHNDIAFSKEQYHYKSRLFKECLVDGR